MIDSTLKNANILIVDDQEANIEVLEGLLSFQGYINVKSTTDSRDVAGLIIDFSPDLILLDLSMPYISGFDVMKQLKTIVPGNTYLPILVLTADVSSESKQCALSGGATDFLTKPFDLVEVGLRIKNLLFISYLQQQLHNQNQILEEKVKERTVELENKNKELNIAKVKAEASDRLKTSFINNISHEIRTPLNGILGLGQILAGKNISPEIRNVYLTMMNQSSDRLINTVTNFLDVSLLSSGNQDVNKKHFELSVLLNDMVDKFKEICKSKNLILSILIPSDEDSFIIYTDSELLYKILYHLIDNAIKFTHHGTISVGYLKNENQLDFFVRDTGIGIAEESKCHVFDYFVQEDITITRGYEGSGLGLPIAKGLLELLGGKIWFDSEKGKGSTFFFSLSDVIPSKVFVRDVNRLSGIENRKQIILVAEDDAINFAYIEILLSRDVIELLHAKDGVEAVEMCHRHPEIDVVLMDLKMPNLDGFEATRQIKLFRKDIPIFAVTAYSGSEDKQKAFQAGCSEFIVKPLREDLLISKLAEYGVFLQ